MPSVPAEVGNTANQYEILSKLAQGGMAEIFLARGASVGGIARYVVLKRILRERATDAALVRMFLDEARLASQLQHQNVAQVYDVGKLGDSYFFTMEYVHGETVRALMARASATRRVLPLGDILAIAAGAAGGLHHAHERLGHDGKPLGIVHRDVSPSNLMVSFEGGIKVVDFGVAKAADRAEQSRSGTIKGKISYLSPEQCKAAPVDRRSDLFSLGIVLWELLTLQRLYRRGSDFESMAAIIGEPAAAPSTKRADVPTALDAIVLRLLEKDAGDRYATAAELLEALEAVAISIGTSLSSSSLARILRDLFGHRPEPWLEADEDSTLPLRVTTEPIPSEISAHTMSSIDLQLETFRAPKQRNEIAAPAAEPLVAARQTRSRWPIALAFVLGAAIVLTIVIVTPSHDTRSFDVPQRTVTTEDDLLLAASKDAEQVARGEPDAHVTELDAYVPTFVADAGTARVVADAWIVTGPVHSSSPRPTRAPPPPDAAIRVVIHEALVDAFNNNQFVTVVAACAAADVRDSADAMMCVLAACKNHDTAHGRQWVREISEQLRIKVATRCAALGVDLGIALPPPLDASFEDWRLPRMTPRDAEDCTGPRCTHDPFRNLPDAR